MSSPVLALVNISKLQVDHTHTHWLCGTVSHTASAFKARHSHTHYNNTISQFPLPLVPSYITRLTHCCFVSPPLPCLNFFFSSFSKCINQIPRGRSKLFISFNGCLSLIAMSSSCFASHNWIKGLLIFSLRRNKSERIFHSETPPSAGVLSKALPKT